jgi:hypothetical protein
MKSPGDAIVPGSFDMDQLLLLVVFQADFRPVLKFELSLWSFGSNGLATNGDLDAIQDGNRLFSNSRHDSLRVLVQ